MIGLQFREELPDAVQRELDQLVAHLKGFLSQSFNEDGSLITGSQDFNVAQTGCILPYGGSTAPDGWLICDGSQKSRVDYKTLFDVIGTSFGVGDGSTTFNIPDGQGRTLIGAGTGSGLTARTLGTTMGAETVTLATNEIPSHNHNHTHTLVTSSGAGATTVVSTTTGTGTTMGSLVSTDATNAGGGGSHVNMQPSLVVNYIILANRRTV